MKEQAAAATDPRLDSPANPLVWQGEITAANAEQVWETTRARLNQMASQNVVIDLSAVRFIDSSGLGVMVRARKLAQRQGTNLLFRGLQPAIRNVLHLARLEEFLLRTSAD